MTQKTKERIHLIYGICLSVMIVVVGVCFALACLSIYQSGQSPFTAENVATHFARIAIPTYICVAGVLGGVILSLAVPVAKVGAKPRREAYAALCRLRKKLDTASCGAEVAKAMAREAGKRRTWLIQAIVITAVSIIVSVVWCVMPGRFSVGNLNEDVKKSVLMLAPYVLASLAIWIDTVYMWDLSVSKETTLVKAALKTGKTVKAGGKDVPQERRPLTGDPRFVWSVRGVILALGVTFVVLGVLNGGMADVLGKAIRICTECIGLG